MASVHPSRLGMVPGAIVPPARRSPTPPPRAPVLSREEELKQKLLAKRSKSTRDESSRSRTPEATAAASSSIGGLKIKGSSKLQEEEAPLADIYRDGTRQEEAGPSRARRDHGSRGEVDQRRRSPSPRRRYDERDDHTRARSRTRQDTDGRQSPRRHSPPRDPDRRPSPSYAPRAENRNDSRERPPNMGDYGYSTQRNDLRAPPPHLPPFPPKWDSRPPGPPNGNGHGNGIGNRNGDPAAPPPMRIGFDAPPPNRGYGQGGFRNNNGPMDFERRRQERQDNPFSIWPPSPKSPYRDEDEMALSRSKSKSKKKSSKSKSKSKKHRRYSSESESTDSEEEDRRRRRRREKRRADKYSEDEREEEGRRRKRRYTSEPNTDSEADMEDRRQRRKSSRTRSKSKSVLSPPPRSSKKDKDWVEKDQEGVPAVARDLGTDVIESDDDGDLVGPQLPVEHKDKARRQAFKDMLPGEAEAMAAFAASGQRIPRRGEIGIDASRIEEFEASGFVMSGNRHKKMTAVRLKKENQVISAEEKRAILNLQKEERMKKEGAIISQFKELLDENWRSQGLKGKPQD